ncbi:MAG TPA: bifunctional aspartate kinase/diaminopimelate decarboxylase [Longimicrobiales bacterium]|nr:bifunctional aspartate kinase/diaminopimelate decarboxylase [Longimicrobiales bacterium]
MSTPSDTERGSVPPRWVVLKYGGTSVADRAHWPRIAEVLRARMAEGLRPVVVHSALAGVSDRLERLGAAAASGSGEHREILAWIRDRHQTLLAGLGLDVPPRLETLEGDLERLAAGVALTGEVSPSLRARIMSSGELMATELAAAALAADGLDVCPVDVRDVLRTTDAHPPGDPRHYLAADFEPRSDGALSEAWAALGGVVVTQGFIARDDAGRTVLLGRGGSDTSAAWIATALGAERLEIWTDVPGMFSANPRLIPSARLLRRLSFEEAQEIAATGAKVLHPRCLPIAHRAGIPVHIHATGSPGAPGTVITDTPAAGPPRIKAVSARTGVTLVSMESLGMWQEPGFLAQAFGVFADLGLSIDLVSTSESVVTVTLDDTVGGPDEETLARLRRDLEPLCRVRVVRPCAAVSLVGDRMRANLHRLAPVLETFEEHEVYMVSQAASDLNFTAVVEEDQVEPLVRNLHSLVIDAGVADEVLGPSWEELAAAADGDPVRPAHWWEEKRERLLHLAAETPSLYVYDGDTIRAGARGLVGMRSVDRVFYAVKANPHPDVLRALHEEGVGFECVSPGELRRVLDLFPDLPRERVIFTPNFAPAEEYAEAFEAEVRVTLDNLYPLEAWPELFRGREIMVRMDIGDGSGHHKHVRTAGVHSKFGVHPDELDRLEALCAAHDVTLTGLHTHSGSGIRDAGHWTRVAGELARVAARFPTVRSLDLGGGLGVPEKEGERPLAPEELDRLLSEVRDAYPDYELWLEPGRYLVSEAGVLLVTVTQTKEKRGTRFVGVSTGMNSLVRPAMYGAYHRIVNLTRLGEPAEGLATVVGPICESGDRLGRDRPLPRTEEGDVLLVANGGAYGHAMASRYNLREPAEEVVV